MKTIKKILVPTDFSDMSLAAIEYATAFSSTRDAIIYFIHVLEQAPACSLPTIGLHPETALRDTAEQAGKELNDFMTTKIQHKGKNIMIVRRGVADREIVRFAKDEKVDLIVMATHGRTGVAHAVLGSVAEKVVRYSIVPVLTVKPKTVQESLLDNSEVEEQLHIGNAGQQSSTSIMQGEQS